MKLNVYFISKNEQFLSNLQFEFVLPKLNQKIELSSNSIKSISDFPIEKHFPNIDSVFFEYQQTEVTSQEVMEFCSNVNTLKIPIILVVSSPEDLSILDTIPVKLWRIIKTYQSKKEIFFDICSAINTLVEYIRIIKEKRIFQETLLVSSHMLTLINEKSEFVYSSPTMKNLHGYEEGELQGKSFIKYIHPEDLYFVLGEFQKVKTSKNYSPTLEFRILTKKGDYLRLESVVNNQLDNPILRSIVINSKDVTKLKTIESTLKFQEERVAKVYSLTSLGIWDWDIINDHVLLSPHLYFLFGSSSSEEIFTFNEFLQFYHPKDREDFKNAILESYSNNPDFYHEHRVIHIESKQERWLLDRGSVVERNEVGEALRIVGTTTDITSRKIAEIQLQEMNEKMRKLTNSLPGMLYQFIRFTDGNMACLYVSKGIEELYEIYDSGDTVDLELFISRTHPDDVQSVIDTINESADTLGVWELEYRLVLPKKKTRWVHGKSRPELLDDGSIVWHGYIYDITESKRNSEHILRNQRMESIGTLAGGIAHDLNNVLTPILLSIEILKSQIHEPALQKRLELIESSTLRGATMVKQVLHFSRGVEGSYSAIEAKLLVKEISILVQSSFPKNIQYIAHIEDDLPYILGDITQLHQVLLNLCVNARDAMPNGGKLEIEVKKFIINDEREYRHLSLQKGVYILIIVSDTGEGMSPDVKSRIFEPFFTTKEIGSGTGLGLSTVLNIVKSHKGYIDVYSEIGKGSSFRIYLQTTTDEVQSQYDKTIEEFSVSNLGVLVVDDEEMIRDFTRYTLESIGFKVYVAENGAEGITVLSQNLSNITLMIVDTMMPIMDGKTTISIAKKLNPDLKIIAVSGITQKFDHTEEFSKVLFLQKPYSSKQLLAAIHSLI
ncbi:MAG: PAS domain-containing protein [Candidatus Kapabacteria bacterium]|nr:PAS domain-containing protein [Candidatus Kapabacteria bacterium]